MTEKNWYDHIYVYDNLVKDDDIIEIGDLAYVPGWQYGKISNSEYNDISFNKEERYNKKTYGIAHMDQHWTLSLNGDQMLSWETEELGVYNLWKIIRKHLDEQFKNMTLDIADCYVTGYTHGMTSLPSVSPNSVWTILYYVNPLWEIEWGGQTVFYKGTDNTGTKLKDEEPDVIKSIYPKPGRFVFFNGAIPYAETPPNNLFPGLKTTLKFNCFSAEALTSLTRAYDPGRPDDEPIQQ